jgi:hypothetical protein
MGKWKQVKDKDDLIKKVAKDTGVMPYQVNVKDGGTIIARRGDEERVIGAWTYGD